MLGPWNAHFRFRRIYERVFSPGWFSCRDESLVAITRPSEKGNVRVLILAIDVDGLVAWLMDGSVSG